MADALATAEGQLEARLLALHEDRLGAVRLDLAVALEKRDGSALAGLTAADLGLEALHVQMLETPLTVEVLGQRIEHVSGAGGEDLTLTPVRAELVQMLGRHPAHGRGVLLVEMKAVKAAVEITKLGPEDHVLRISRRVKEHRVRELVVARELPEHAHDRGDAAAGADEEHLLRERVGENEVALDAAEGNDRTRATVADQVRRDDAALDELQRD